MRELEFIPEWYPRLARRKRWLAIQVWIGALLAVGLVVWLVQSHRNIQAAQDRASVLGGELDHSRRQLRKLDDLLALQKQWGRQYEMLQVLGPHVEAARLLSTLAKLMPPEMALLEADIDRSRPASAQFVYSRGGDSSPQTSDGPARMDVHLLGVAPTDVDVANFLAKLSDQPYFQSVSMTYARDRNDNGHKMRQFEVSFSIQLSEK
jgi:Tfp pilus assembly protein PilN